ncbi:MAG: EamA family transporter [Zetaproteobacteria bacterium]|nr:EamA family transporter [Zetaproteobacteria bacterium]
MSWITYACLSTGLFGLWALTGKLSTTQMEPLSVLLFQILGGLGVGLIVFTWKGFQVEANWKGVLWCLTFGISGMVATLAYIQALALGQASTVTVVTSLYPAVTLALSILFLGERINLRQSIGMLLAGAAIYLLISGEQS